MNELNKGIAPLIAIIIIALIALIGGGAIYYYGTNTHKIIQIQQGLSQQKNTQQVTQPQQQIQNQQINQNNTTNNVIHNQTDQVSSCGKLTVQVISGDLKFSPTECSLTSTGVPLTRKGYVALELRETYGNNTPAAIMISLSSLGLGSFTASSNNSINAISGNLQLDNYNDVVTLKEGSITIESVPVDNSLIDISFDLYFGRGIHIKGFGKVLFRALAGA